MTQAAWSSRLAFLTFFLFATAISAMASPARTVCKPPADFPNPALLASLAKGVNLPGWDDPDPARRPNAVQLQALRGFGFTHIRLLIDNRRLSGPAPDIIGYLADIRQQIKLLIGMGYVVSIDLHADHTVGDLFAQDRGKGITYLEGIWQDLATLASAFPPSKVAVELLNEPEIDQPTWEAVSETLRKSVRAIVPDHKIIIGPSGPQRYEMLSGMKPFNDRNIVYAIHYYDPFLFTHQGATWGDPREVNRALSGLPFPASLATPAVRNELKKLSQDGRKDAADGLRDSLHFPWDEHMIAGAFDQVAAWSRKYDSPVIINEFGVLSFAAPRKSRLIWLASVNRIAREHCLGWAHWDFKDGFGLIDNKTGLPDSGIMESLRDRD